MRTRTVPFPNMMDSEPIGDLNTTPLIDVMLVLLVMFIVTIPIATHKVKLDLPTGPGETEPKVFRLDMDSAGRLYWDGAPLAEARLPARLAVVREAGADASLEFRADGESRYEDFDRVLAVLKRAEISSLGLVGNERFAGLD
ncbi:MAG TPA: biopolymer transporter ExbD [Allosphingosinicella sp.]